MTEFFQDVLPKTNPGNNSVLPADFGSLGQGKWRNLFFPGETLTFPIAGGVHSDQPAPTQSIASWQVRNYAGTVVASGGPIAVGGTLTVPAQPLGWYRVEFSRSSPISKWGTDAGGGMFSVVPADKAGMRPRPAVGAVPLDATAKLFDPGTRGMLGSAAYRMSIAQGRGGTYTAQSASYAAVDADLVLNQQNMLAYDAARPHPTVINFPDTFTPDTAQAADFATTVQRYSTVDYFELYNEPTMSAGLAADYGRFRTMVKAGRSSAQIVGPCPVVIGSAEVDANVRQFFAAGGGAHLDGIAWHQYNGVNGDLANGRKTLDNWVTFLTEFGQQNKPRIVTEAGHFYAHNHGAFTPRKQAPWVLMEMMLLEQYKVPKESYLYYYDVNGGYEAQPGHMLTSTLLPFPIIALLRVYGQELFAAPYESRLDFGTVDNHLAIGSTFRRADGTGTAVLMTAGVRALPVVLQLPQSVTSVVTVDQWGATTTRSVTGGLLTLELGVLPTYVRLPAGATCTVVATAYGTNRLAGRTPTGSSPFGDIAKTTNGERENPYHYNWSQAPGQGGGAGEAVNPAWNVWETTKTLPQTWTCTLAAPAAVNAVIVEAPPPHQQISRPLDYDVQTTTNGTDWTTVATYTDAPLVVQRHSTGYDGANSFVETYDDEAHRHVVRFTRQTGVTGVRLVVRSVTIGGMPTMAAATAFGELDNQGQPIYVAHTRDVATLGTRLMLQEVSAYDAAEVSLPADPPPAAAVTPVRFKVKVGRKP